MVCSVEGCGRAVYVASRGLCSRHYARQRTTGTTDSGPRAKRPFEERLWAQIEKRGTDECWPWIAKSKTAGYGYIGLGGRKDGKMLAHRAVWEQTYGAIPVGGGHHGTVVMHVCDNRLCCNPSHLRLGTQSENVRDMDAKGRRRTVALSGEAHHNARFSTADVEYIRSSRKRGVDLAGEFGCHRAVISGIRLGNSRKHG